MSEILRRLNEEHYAGNYIYVPIYEWETAWGELGLYETDAEGIVGENLLLIILAGDKLNVRMLSARNDKVAIFEAKHIAKFAGARLLESKKPATG